MWSFRREERDQIHREWFDGDVRFRNRIKSGVIGSYGVGLIAADHLWYELLNSPWICTISRDKHSEFVEMFIDIASMPGVSLLYCKRRRIEPRVFNHACAAGTVSMIEYFTDNGVAKMESALEIAAMRGSESICDVLTARGFPVTRIAYLELIRRGFNRAISQCTAWTLPSSVGKRITCHPTQGHRITAQDVRCAFLHDNRYIIKKSLQMYTPQQMRVILGKDLSRKLTAYVA